MQAHPIHWWPQSTCTQLETLAHKSTVALRLRCCSWFAFETRSAHAAIAIDVIMLSTKSTSRTSDSRQPRSICGQPTKDARAVCQQATSRVIISCLSCSGVDVQKYLTFCTSTSLTACLSACPSLWLSVSLFICPSNCLCHCLSKHLPPSLSLSLCWHALSKYLLNVYWHALYPGCLLNCALSINLLFLFNLHLTSEKRKCV